MIIDTFPIVFFDVESNSLEIVRVLCRAGADPRKRPYPAGLPILLYIIVSSEYELSGITDTLLALLASGPAPDEVPSDIWEAPLKTLRGYAPSNAENGEPNVHPWCTKEIRKALARNLTHAAILPSAR